MNDETVRWTVSSGERAELRRGAGGTAPKKLGRGTLVGDRGLCLIHRVRPEWM